MFVQRYTYYILCKYVTNLQNIIQRIMHLVQQLQVYNGFLCDCIFFPFSYFWCFVSNLYESQQLETNGNFFVFAYHCVSKFKICCMLKQTHKKQRFKIIFHHVENSKINSAGTYTILDLSNINKSQNYYDKLMQYCLAKTFSQMIFTKA